MPVILKIQHNDGQRTAVWEITENEPDLLNMALLNPADFSTFSSIANPGRRLEWLAVRALLKEFYASVPSIVYSQSGRPFLLDSADKISVSHSGKMVGIVLHPSRNPGIDIEAIHPRIFKISARFLSKSENKFLNNNPSAAQLVTLWAAKEVMFKVYDLSGVSFKNNLEVEPFVMSSNGKLKGIIFKDDNTLSLPMEYRQFGDYMLVQTDFS